MAHNGKAAHPDGVEFYRSGILRKWRWRITANNGLIIGSSSQGYFNKSECYDNLGTVGRSINQFFGTHRLPKTD